MRALSIFVLLLLLPRSVRIDKWTIGLTEHLPFADTLYEKVQFKVQVKM